MYPSSPACDPSGDSTAISLAALFSLLNMLPRSIPAGDLFPVKLAAASDINCCEDGSVGVCRPFLKLAVREGIRPLSSSESSQDKSKSTLLPVAISSTHISSRSYN